MANLTDQEYYGDSSKWGQSNFVSLESIIQNIMLTADDDSYFKHVKKFRASIHGKQLLKDLDLGFMSSDKALSIQVPSNRIFPFPKYMTSWSRISALQVKNRRRTLYALNINNRAGINDYLQDNETELLYDNDGNVIEGSSFDAELGHCKAIVCGADQCRDADFTKSWVRQVKEGGYFLFSDDLVDVPIVIEYTLSGLDGLADCDVKVVDALEQVLTNGIKWKLTQGKRNVPLSEPTYWYTQYKKEKEKARDILADKITINEIVRAVSLRYNA